MANGPWFASVERPAAPRRAARVWSTMALPNDGLVFWVPGAQFCGIIGVIFLAELAVAVLAVLFQSQVREWINGFFLANVRAYRDDIDLQNLMDTLQRTVSRAPAPPPAPTPAVPQPPSLRRRTSAAARSVPTTGTSTFTSAATKRIGAEKSAAFPSPAASPTPP